MGRWWDTEMASTSQALYADPSVALDVATVPDGAFSQPTQDEYEQQQESVQEKRSGLLGWIAGIGDKADDVANTVSGGVWDAVQDNVLKPVGKAVWYPVDKLASGAHWLYSNAVSQPLSTLILASASADLADKSLFSGSTWANAYEEAETTSPGQAFENYANTSKAQGGVFGTIADASYGVRLASGDPFALAGIFKDDSVTAAEKDAINRNTERFLYDNDFWRNKQGWNYTVGTGALDMASNMALDPTTHGLTAVSSVLKGVRTLKFAEEGGQLVRDQGGVINTAKKIVGSKPQTLEEVSRSKKLEEFYDWTQKPGIGGAARKTQAEIAAHPIFDGGFRRGNPARQQLASVFANSAREDMPLIYRYAAGDASAAPELMARGTSTLDDIGRMSENRKLVDSVNFDPAILAYFAEREGAKVAASAVTKLPEDLTEQAAKLHEQAAKSVMQSGTRFKINASGMVSKRFAREADQWKAGQLSLIDDEITRVGGIGDTLRVALGSNLGKEASEFTTAVESAHLFGSLPEAYRMGTGVFADTSKKVLGDNRLTNFRNVGKAADKKFARSVADRPGVFSTESLRKGFYRTPIRILQSFGDRTPVGRINHNDADAGDRLLDMLKQVPKLGPEARARMLDDYLTAGDKVAKSRKLEQINTIVLNHMAQNVHGLNAETAGILNGMIKVGIDSTVNQLMKKTAGSTRYGTAQRFSTATREGEKKTVDMVEDGVGWSASPLASTQLSQTDSLLPIREINRVLSRNSGGLQKLHQFGGKGVDIVRAFADNFNTIWKASTLLRPAYTVRMVSEEMAAAAVKFGFFSHLVGGGSKGATNWVLNRGQYLKAEFGLGSYAPSTGAGVDSKLSVVRIGDEEIEAIAASRKADLADELAAAQALPKNPVRVGELKAQLKGSKGKRRKEIKAELKKYYDQSQVDRLTAEHAAVGTKRIRVAKSLPVIDARIQMERELLAGVESDLAKFTKQVEAQRTKMAEKGSTPKRETRLAELRSRVAGIQDQVLDHRAVIDEFTQYSNYVLQKAVESTGRRVGTGEFIYRGIKVPQAFSKEWDNPILRAQLDDEGDAAAASLISRAEAVDRERLIKSGNWVSVEPKDPNHMDSWLRAINLQFGQDEGFRLAMSDSTGQALRAWLKTPQGKQHMAEVGSAAKDPERFADSIILTIDKYLPESSGLRQKLLDGKQITKADLAGKISAKDYPVVHGEEILEKTSLWGKTTPGHIIDTAVRKGFKRLGQIPQSVMSRNPVYIKFQEGRMKELLDNELRVRQAQGKEGAITKDELEALMHKSDKLARKDMSQIVYDPMRTTASEALRFMTPFFSAHADGLTRWSGLIAEKPQYLGRIAQIYNAPVAAGMITDTQGNAVGADGYVDVRDPSTGEFVERKFVPIQDRVFQLRAPWADKTKGSYPIKIQSMNTILPGDPWWNPGSGPLVQIAGSQIAKASPQTGDFLQWAKILPYGPSGSVTEAVTPKYMRALWDAYKGDDPDNEEYQKAYLAIWNKKQMEFMENGTKFSTKDIENEAKQFLYLNVLEAWGSPAQSSNTPLTGTPYQFFVDQLAQLKKIDPENAYDKFLAKYGTDYAGFTASLTKSMGIAATISADRQAEKYRDEIAADPDMAAFWVGDVYNGGPFSSAVYNKQFDQNFGAEKARERIPAEHAIENNQINAGWDDYKKAKLYLDSLLYRNGFKSYSATGAEQLNQARQQLVAGISAKYPSWGEAFNETDRGLVPKRIDSFTKAVQDEKLSSDPMRTDIPVLRQYLIGRQQFKAALAERGLSQLSYVDNPITGAREATGNAADIGQAWEQFRAGLANSSVAFNELMNRYLSNDDLQ